MVLKDANLLGNNVNLFADLGADLHERVAIVSTYALCLRQLVADNLARQRRVQGLAATLLALMAGNECGVVFIDLCWRCLIGRRERFGLIEE